MDCATALYLNDDNTISLTALLHLELSAQTQLPNLVPATTYVHNKIPSYKT